jgi:group I intron endonuclease
MGYIYILTSSSSGKSYVGQTTREIEERLGEHQEHTSACRAIRNAIQKHGWDSFIADYYECPDDELNKNEKWMVELLGTLSPWGYNLREGGGSRGKFSDDTKKKLSESRVGEKNHRYGTKTSEETKQKVQKMWTEEKRKEHGLKISGFLNPMFGKPRDEETKEKIRMSWSEERKEYHRELVSGDKNPMFGVRGEEHPWWGRSHTEETIQKNKDSQLNSQKVYQYTLEGKYIQSFDSYREAGRRLDFDYIPISRCARGKQKTAYGFLWSRDPPLL